MDLSGSAEDNNIISSYPSFVEVNMNDAKGDNQAQMSVSIVADAATGPGSCDDDLSLLLEGALSAVLAVGPILSKGFQITCQKSTPP